MHARELPDNGRIDTTEEHEEEPLTPEQIAVAQVVTEARDFRSLAAASNLIAQRLAGRFIILDDVGEGTIFPDDTEETSGIVLDEHGDLWSFWTAWNAAAEQPTLSIWRRTEASPRDYASDEYRRARAMVGLPPLVLAS